MKLRDWRIKFGVSVDQFSELSGIPTSTIYCYENGSRRPRPSVAERIQTLTDGAVSIAELLGISGGVKEESASFRAETDLAVQARGLGLDPEAIARKAVEDAVKRARMDAWIAENREAFAANARDVEENGLWCDRYRQF